MPQPAAQSCANCQFFNLGDVASDTQGKCHRYPPSIGGNAWPTVNTDKWCGEWKQAKQE